MKNAHLRIGWLTYFKRTEKTTTTFRLRMDRFIGEVERDPPRQARAHFISVLGGDTQIAAVNAATRVHSWPLRAHSAHTQKVCLCGM